MPLQETGAISLSDVQTEFGGTNPIPISEYYGSDDVPESGTISLSDFYGTTAYEATWTGTFSIPVSAYSSTLGIETSGSMFRYVNRGYSAGTWATANIDGTFTSVTSTVVDGYLTDGFRSGLASGGTASQVQTGIPYHIDIGFVTYTIGTGWTGHSEVIYQYQTSGGLLRLHTYDESGTAGAWLTLG